MEPTKEMIDAIYQERVLRARQSSIAEKLMSGADLFEEVCERMAAGIRSQYPDYDDAAVLALMRKRLERLRRIEGTS